MILRPNGPTRVAITQPDHAALAAHIMRSWRANGLPTSPRRDAIVLAVAEHDNGWREIDAQRLIDPATGAVLDFMTVSGDIKRSVWPRAIARLAAAPFSAALVAHHAAHVYSRYRTDPEWASFFPEMETLRDRHLDVAGVSMRELLDDYVFLRIGDLASLTFCTATDMRAGEFGYDVRLERDTVIVTPDPFEGEAVPLHISGRDLRDADTIVTITGVARGGR
jgi:Protein of unknown function (DUF3891)